MVFFLITCTIIVLMFFILLFFSLKNGVPPIPTSSEVRKVLISFLPDLKEGVVVELGSGWGNLIFPLSKKYNNCQIIGYENSLIPYVFSFLINYASNLKIVRKNFFETSLQGVDLVVCYLVSKKLEKLKVKFEEELKPGAKIISHTFSIPGWIPNSIIEVGDHRYSKIYLYEVP